MTRVAWQLPSPVAYSPALCSLGVAAAAIRNRCGCERGLRESPRT